MFKPFQASLITICLVSLSFCFAEDPDSSLPQIISTTEIEEPQPDSMLEASTPALPLITEPTVAQVVEKRTPFSPFTGKVRGRKVRLRLHPELDGPVLREVGKGEFISIVGEKGDFWAVEPLLDTKAYIFRSFVLDNTVEVNRVNVRLEPNLDSAIIAHLNTGDRVEGTVHPDNNKWLEITPPSSVRFYIAKEFVENVGGPEVKREFELRKSKVKDLLETTALLAKAELHKSFPEIDLERIDRSCNLIIQDYKDFPDYVELAKNELSSIKEAYLLKKIEHLENRAAVSEESFAAEDAMDAGKKGEGTTDKMKLWDPIEESLYLTWARLNEDRTMHEYYDEQKLNSIVLTGIVESYMAAVKNKPGSHVIRDERDLPVAYIYSTHINLDQYIGKKISFVASLRPNNNFAFPAYFIHDIQ